MSIPFLVTLAMAAALPGAQHCEVGSPKPRDAVGTSVHLGQEAHMVGIQ